MTKKICHFLFIILKRDCYYTVHAYIAPWVISGAVASQAVADYRSCRHSLHINIGPVEGCSTVTTIHP